jgi:fatty acid desaturase
MRNLTDSAQVSIKKLKIKMFRKQLYLWVVIFVLFVIILYMLYLLVIYGGRLTPPPTYAAAT